MIRFNRISGFVTISNRKGFQCIAPHAGMTMPLVGADFIVVTGTNGIAEINVDNHYVLIEENSYLHVRPDGRSFLRKHKEKLFGQNTVKLACGHIWAFIQSRVGREEGEEYPASNVAVGVRG